MRGMQAQHLAAALATLMLGPILLKHVSDNAKTINSQSAAGVIAQEFLNDFELLCTRKNNERYTTKPRHKPAPGVCSSA